MTGTSSCRLRAYATLWASLTAAGLCAFKPSFRAHVSAYLSVNAVTALTFSCTPPVYVKFTLDATEYGKVAEGAQTAFRPILPVAQNRQLPKHRLHFLPPRIE
jgi:hypothetical protein